MLKSASIQELRMQEAALQPCVAAMQEHAAEMTGYAQELYLRGESLASPPPLNGLTMAAASASPTRSAEERLKDYQQQREAVQAAVRRVEPFTSPRRGMELADSPDVTGGKGSWKPNYTKYKYGNF